MTIQVDQPGISVSPLLYGIFFEEINRAGDGGLYAEMVQNRAFEDDPGKPVAWSLVRTGEAEGNIALDTAQPLNSHTPTSLRLEVVDPKSGCVGAANEGFQGIAVKQGGQYRLSFYARCSNGSRGLATASLRNATAARCWLPRKSRASPPSGNNSGARCRRRRPTARRDW